MKLNEMATPQIIERGFEYYEDGHVISCCKIGDHAYDGDVLGSEDNTYKVHIDLEEPEKSTCTCPYAQREDVVACKHMMALYFYTNPEKRKAYKREKNKREEINKNVRDFRGLLSSMYYFCDFLSIANPEENDEWEEMTMRDVLDQELVRMGAYIVMNEQSHNREEGVNVINMMLSTDLTMEQLEKIDQLNRTNNTYKEIPLDIEISVEADAEGMILDFFRCFGETIVKVCIDDGDNQYLVDTYIDNLQDCLYRVVYTSPQEKTGDEASTEPEKSLEELLQELDSLIGLENVKQEVRTMTNLVRIRKLREERGLGHTERSLHMVFSGNPGTGKTTVARLIAKIYKALGVLSKGHLTETDRSGLVAGYVGQTALKTAEVIEKAMGGVLFVDEAYALANKGSENDYGQEAIETLLKAMEDNRGDFIVIVAGYTDLMDNFLNSNPGLRSRFSQTLFFEDYDAAQLLDIFCKMCKDSDFSLSEDAKDAMKQYFNNLYENRDENFANARDVRNAFEKILARQANRLAAVQDTDLTDEMLLEIKKEDTEIE